VKQLYSTIIFLILSNIIYSQDLNLKLLDQLTTTSFVDIDDVMINGYGFEEMDLDTKEKGRKEYIKLYNNDIDKAIAIAIINLKDFSRNALDIKVAKGYSLRKIKDDIVHEGYLYNGTNKYGLTVYKKDDVYFLIANEPNDVGATQILLIYKR